MAGFDWLWVNLGGCDWFLADHGWFCVVAYFVTNDKKVFFKCIRLANLVQLT